MKAIGVMKHGGPEVLEVIDLPKMNAGPGQIRIRNYAAAVNPVDVSVRNGSMAAIQAAQSSTLCSRNGCCRNCRSNW